MTDFTKGSIRKLGKAILETVLANALDKVKIASLSIGYMLVAKKIVLITL